MKSEKMLELYSDYLLASCSKVSATGLSAMTGGEVSHDSVTRFLSYRPYSSKDLWLLSKPLVRKSETEEGVLIVDDTIEEKPYTDENLIVSWHYDHSKGRSVKGINIVTMLANYDEKGSFPVSYQIVEKDKEYIDKKDGKKKRRASKSKNQMFLEMVDSSIANQVKFKYVLGDIWFASNNNMTYLKLKKHKDFILGIKGNRNIALSAKDKQNNKFQSLSSLNLDDGAKEVYLQGVAFSVLVSKRVFTNEDGTTGTLYLVSSDLDLDANQMYAYYQKRWKIEEYHKSLKQNAALAKSPTKTVRTQSNHIFASIYAFCKLQVISIGKSMNHFAIRAHLLLEATKVAFKNFVDLKSHFFDMSTA